MRFEGIVTAVVGVLLLEAKARSSTGRSPLILRTKGLTISDDQVDEEIPIQI